MTQLPHVRRVVDEKEELDKKLNLLKAFITSNPIFQKLDEAEQHRLQIQLSIMQAYSDILYARISAYALHSR